MCSGRGLCQRAVLRCLSRARSVEANARAPTSQWRHRCRRRGSKRRAQCLIREPPPPRARALHTAHAARTGDAIGVREVLDQACSRVERGSGTKSCSARHPHRPRAIDLSCAVRGVPWYIVVGRPGGRRRSATLTRPTEHSRESAADDILRPLAGSFLAGCVSGRVCRHVSRADSRPHVKSTAVVCECVCAVRSVKKDERRRRRSHL